MVTPLRHQRGRRVGNKEWMIVIANQLGIESKMNSRSCPKRS